MQPDSRVEYFRTKSAEMFGKTGRKLIPNQECVAELCEAQRNGDIEMAIVSGKFWAGIQPPHLFLFREAKKLAHNIIVVCAMNSETSLVRNQRLPMYCEDDRIEMASHNPFIDFVILFDEDTPEVLCQILEPAYLVKGADWTGKELPEAKYCKCVHLAQSNKGFHMSDIIIAYRKGKNAAHT